MEQVGLSTFLDFYDENRDVILMPESGSHPINRAGFTLWKEHLSSLHNISRNKRSEITTYLKFADVLENSLRYITFSEYLSVIKRIAPEIMKVINENDLVFFVVEGGLNKSNTWVALLFIRELLEIGLTVFTDKVICCGIKRVPTINKIVTDNPEKTSALIYFDDMAYTGSQIVANEGLERIRCKQCPDADYLKVKYYLAIAYLTSTAKAKLIKAQPEGVNAIFFENTVILPSFMEQVLTYYHDEPATIRKLSLLCDAKFENRTRKAREVNRNTYINIKRGHNVFGCVFGQGQTAVYFDHKLGDYISVMRNLLSRGLYPENISRSAVVGLYKEKRAVNGLFSESLIKGCTKDDCFEPYYKTIKYSFYGVKLYAEAGIIKQLKTHNNYAMKNKRA